MFLIQLPVSIIAISIIAFLGKVCFSFSFHAHLLEIFEKLKGELEEAEKCGSSEHKDPKQYNWFRREKSKIMGKDFKQERKGFELCALRKVDRGSPQVSRTKVPNKSQALIVGFHRF